MALGYQRGPGKGTQLDCVNGSNLVESKRTIRVATITGPVDLNWPVRRVDCSSQNAAQGTWPTLTARQDGSFCCSSA